MRTFSIGRSKVQHVPARDDDAGVTSLCGKITGQGKDHTDGTPTCKPCLHLLAVAERDAQNQEDRRNRYAAAQAAEQARRDREAAELAEAFAHRVQYATHTAVLLPYGERSDQWTSRSRFEGTDADGPWIEYRTYSQYVNRHVHATLYYCGPDGAARREHGGPELPGPYAAMIPQDTVLADTPQAQPAQVVYLNEGDTVLFNGLPMLLVDDDPHGYPRFVTPAQYGLIMALRQVQALALDTSAELIAAKAADDATEAARLDARYRGLGDAQAAIRGAFDVAPWDGRQPGSAPLTAFQAEAVARLRERYALRNALLEHSDEEPEGIAARERLDDLGELSPVERAYLRWFGWLARHEQRRELDTVQPTDYVSFSTLNDLGWVVGGSSGRVVRVEREEFGGHVTRLFVGRDARELTGWELDHVKLVRRDSERG